MARITVFMIFILSLSSCVRSSREMVIHSDFEQLSSWYPMPTVVEGKGHSGYAYSRTDSEHPFSACFCRKVIELGPERMKAVELSVFVRPEEQGAWAYLVLSIDREGKNYKYYSLDSRDRERALHEWTKMEARFELPADLQYDDVLKVYVWNVSNHRLDADDFEIRFKF